SVPITRRSRLVGQDLIVSGDALVSVFGGNDQSNQSSSSHIFLQKTALDGTLLWVKKYNIPDIATETPMGVVALPDGYVILANSGTLIRTDLEGKVYWGQQIKDFLPAAPVYSKSQNQIMSDGQALYLAGTLPAPLSETYGAWVKVDLNGNISGCPKLLPRTVLELSMDSSFYERRVLQQSDASISSPSAVANTPASAPMKISVLCQNAGPAPENPCEPITSVQHWGDASQPNAITLLRPASDTTLYAAGRLGDRLLLAKLAADGSPLWMKTMPGPDSLTITDLIRDSEGWMVACGHRADPLRGRLAFAFRYQPDTDSLNWWQELGAPVEDGGTLIEIASGLMNYQLCHNVRKPDGRLVSQVVVLSRSTGVVQTAGGRNYDPLSRSQTFSAGAIGEQDRYFVIGRGSSQAGRSRVLLGSLIPSYGGVAWLQLGHKDTLVPGVFAQHSTLLYDQGHIIALYTGHPDATAQTDPTRLYLRKVSPLGAGIWLREYDVAITGDLFMEKTAGGYVICARLGPNRHLMMRTDFNGNLLVVKQISLGGVVGNGSSLGHLQHRIAVLGDYVYFAFYNEHTQQAVLVKTNLNLEVQGNCSG
ncbi:MAG TPA: hypothetical protein PKD78_12355, partial [Saprospiraceae bacterium]|nr:hypothetical protein [Saprospiraceae bacterium]